MSDIEWTPIAASQVVPGDRVKWGYGAAMKNSYRTVSKVERRGYGIVAIYYHETWQPFHDQYAENYPISIARRR